MNSWIDIAGWTLIHFVWQGALIGVIAAVVLRLLRNSRPQLRYAAACTALLVMLAAPAVTAAVIARDPVLQITRALHLLREPNGNVVGLAITPPSSSSSSSSVGRALSGPPVGSSVGRALSGPPPEPTEIAFPVVINIDTVLRWTVTFWSLGVLFLLLRLGTGCWRVQRLQRNARLEPPSEWQRLAEEIASRLGLPARFSVVDSLRVTTPMVAGWLRPVILLPAAAMSGLTPQQVEAVLAHELAHIRRHDFAINLLQTLAETILFYHPAVWWVSGRIREEREHCCDDVAVTVCGDAREYAAALTELATWSVTHAPLAMAATRGSLIARVRRLLHAPDAEDAASRRSLVATTLVLGGLLFAGALGVMVKAQPLVTTPDGEFRLGPPEINLMLGYELFPGPVRLPTDDPFGAKAWDIRLEGSGATMPFVGFSARSLIREAYGLGGMPIVNVPSWMDKEWFDISVPADLSMTNGVADSAEVQAALRRFLEDRMGLTTHREQREFPAYALVRANADGSLGPNIAPSTSDCFGDRLRGGSNPPAVLEPRLEARAPGQLSLRFCGFDNNLRGLTGTRVTIAELAEEFHREHYPMAPDREIVDQTGLDGEYDLDLRFGFLPLAAIAHAHPTVRALLHPLGFRNVYSALPEQLGLKLVDATVSHEVLVIDQINQP